jgi:hypothetical protein
MAIDSAPTLETKVAQGGGSVPKDPIDKIIVAIHGIGSQSRSSTIRSVASRFGDRCEPPLPLMPLGYFNLGEIADVRISYLETRPDGDESLKNVGFAEIFWADIPRDVVKSADLLEETKAWGRTVVSRAEATYQAYVPAGGQLTAADFKLGIGVVEELVETIGVLERLLAVAEKVGVFKFELAPLLRDYIGDVQIVADFPFQRAKVLYRFHGALAKIVDSFAALNRQNNQARRPEIYIIAHSEGSVISFLGMLEAFKGGVATDPERKGPDVDRRAFITDVRGYMTIGSPIDKHIVLWPRLWDFAFQSRIDTTGSIVFEGPKQPSLVLPQKIQWRNYYDQGDPIGFQLDTAVELLHKIDCKAFEFDTEKNDFGFTRYLLPGKAHNDYWTDDEVFGHFIQDVVFAGDEPAKRPDSKRFVGLVSTMIPYAVTFLLHLAAVFVLYKGITAFVVDDVQQFAKIASQMVLLGGMLMGITVAARLPRLVKTIGIRWQLAAGVAFLAGVLPSVLSLPDPVAEYLGGSIKWLVSWTGFPDVYAGRAALFVAAALVACTGWWTKREPRRGRRWLLGVGTGLIFYIVVRRWDGSMSAPIWPILLAGLAFLYLWWLAILMFDLTFIWHRYIRQSVAIDTLRQWQKKHDAVPNAMMGLGRRRPAATRRAP